MDIFIVDTGHGFKGAFKRRHTAVIAVEDYASANGTKVKRANGNTFRLENGEMVYIELTELK